MHERRRWGVVAFVISGMDGKEEEEAEVQWNLKMANFVIVRIASL